MKRILYTTLVAVALLTTGGCGTTADTISRWDDVTLQRKYVRHDYVEIINELNLRGYVCGPILCAVPEGKTSSEQERMNRKINPDDYCKRYNKNSRARANCEIYH
jgi:hypothetical protein